MDNAEFAKLVRLCTEANSVNEGWAEANRAIEAILDKANAPEFWREPIRVMAQGAYYYSADEWMKQHAEYVPGQGK